MATAQTGYFIPSERYSGGTVSDICQDKYGFVWIATDNGLNRFDGYNFTTYNHSYEDSLTINNNIVTKLLCDREGNLWVGTRTGLARFDYVEENLVRYHVDPPHTRILSFLQLHNDTLLVGSSGHGLYKLEGDHLEKREGMTSYGGNFYFNQMTEDSKGRYWKVGYGKEITMHDYSGVKSIMFDQGVAVKLVEIRDTMLVVSQKGITYIKDQIVDFAEPPFTSYIRSAYSDGNDIYIGTDGDGLYVYHTSTRQYEPIKCSIRGIDMSSTTITAIYGDNMGNIWLGCYAKGLVLIPKKQPLFSEWSVPNGADATEVIMSVCKGDSTTLWCTAGKAGMVYGGQGGRFWHQRQRTYNSTSTIATAHRNHLPRQSGQILPYGWQHLVFIQSQKRSIDQDGVVSKRNHQRHDRRRRRTLIHIHISVRSYHLRHSYRHIRKFQNRRTRFAARQDMQQLDT